MARLVEFVLVPAVAVGRGRVEGRLAESDIINRYTKALSDELENCAIRHRVGSTVYPYEFVIHCSIGWTLKPFSKQPPENTSRVYIGRTDTSLLASEIAESLSHWGCLYASHGHRSSRPIADLKDEKIREGVGGVRIEPFVLNGPNAEIYCLRLETLGRDIGRTIAEYVESGKHGAKIKAPTAESMLPRLVRRIY